MCGLAVYLLAALHESYCGRGAREAKKRIATAADCCSLSGCPLVQASPLKDCLKTLKLSRALYQHGLFKSKARVAHPKLQYAFPASRKILSLSQYVVSPHTVLAPAKPRVGQPATQAPACPPPPSRFCGLRLVGGRRGPRPGKGGATLGANLHRFQSNAQP